MGSDPATDVDDRCLSVAAFGIVAKQSLKGIGSRDTRPQQFERSGSVLGIGNRLNRYCADSGLHPGNNAPDREPM